MNVIKEGLLNWKKESFTKPDFSEGRVVVHDNLEVKGDLHHLLPGRYSSALPTAIICGVSRDEESEFTLAINTIRIQLQWNMTIKPTLESISDESFVSKINVHERVILVAAKSGRVVYLKFSNTDIFITWHKAIREAIADMLFTQCFALSPIDHSLSMKRLDIGLRRGSLLVPPAHCHLLRARRLKGLKIDLTEILNRLAIDPKCLSREEVIAFLRRVEVDPLLVKDPQIKHLRRLEATLKWQRELYPQLMKLTAKTYIQSNGEQRPHFCSPAPTSLSLLKEIDLFSPTNNHNSLPSIKEIEVKLANLKSPQTTPPQALPNQPFATTQTEQSTPCCIVLLGGSEEEEKACYDDYHSRLLWQQQVHNEHDYSPSSDYSSSLAPALALAPAPLIDAVPERDDDEEEEADGEKSSFYQHKDESLICDNDPLSQPLVQEEEEDEHDDKHSEHNDEIDYQESQTEDKESELEHDSRFFHEEENDEVVDEPDVAKYQSMAVYDSVYEDAIITTATTNCFYERNVEDNVEPPEPCLTRYIDTSVVDHEKYAETDYKEEDEKVEEEDEVSIKCNYTLPVESYAPAPAAAFPSSVETAARVMITYADKCTMTSPYPSPIRISPTAAVTISSHSKRGKESLQLKAEELSQIEEVLSLLDQLTSTTSGSALPIPVAADEEEEVEVDLDLDLLFSHPSAPVMQYQKQMSTYPMRGLSSTDIVVDAQHDSDDNEDYENEQYKIRHGRSKANGLNTNAKRVALSPKSRSQQQQQQQQQPLLSVHSSSFFHPKLQTSTATDTASMQKKRRQSSGQFSPLKSSAAGDAVGDENQQSSNSPMLMMPMTTESLTKLLSSYTEEIATTETVAAIEVFQEAVAPAPPTPLSLQAGLRLGRGILVKPSSLTLMYKRSSIPFVCIIIAATVIITVIVMMRGSLLAQMDNLAMTIAAPLLLPPPPKFNAQDVICIEGLVMTPPRLTKSMMRVILVERWKNDGEMIKTNLMVIFKAWLTGHAAYQGIVI